MINESSSLLDVQEPMRCYTARLSFSKKNHEVHSCVSVNHKRLNLFGLNCLIRMD